MRGSPDNDDLVPLHEPFETALRGFNRRQVLEHLESLDGRIAVIAADRDAALTQVAELSKVMNHLRLQSELLEHLRQEAHHASARVERILATPMDEASARIQRIMRLAGEEAAELKATAEAEIATARARADQELAELKASADEQITSLRAQASREAKSLLEHARRQCDQLEAESAARRDAAEQDAAQASTKREAAANARIQDSELRSIARFHLMHQVIGAQLSTQMCAVDRDESALRELRTQVADDVTALETLRAEVTAAMAATYQVLTEALGQIAGTAIVDRVPEDPNAMKRAEVPHASTVPTQRNAEGGTVYLLNAGAEGRRSPRAPS